MRLLEEERAQEREAVRAEIADLSSQVSHWQIEHGIAAARIRALEAGVQAIIDGDVPRPIGKRWRADCKPNSADRCVHDARMYEDCSECIADHLRALLDVRG